MTCRNGLTALVLVVLLAGVGQGVPLPEAKKAPEKEDGKPTALSPDGRVAASAEGDIITLADVSQQVPVVRAKIKTRSPVRALAYSPDGKLLAAGSDRDVSLFDAATGKQILSFQHGNGASQSVQFSPDGSQLTVTTATGAQLLLEARTGRLIKVSK